MEGVFGATQEASEHRERESPERRFERAKARGVAGKTYDLRRLTVGNRSESQASFPANLEGPVNSKGVEMR